MKANMMLIASAAVIFLGLYLVFPYTDMGKEAYEANRSNALSYIMAYRYDPNPEYQREIKRLIEKYNLQEEVKVADNPLDYFKNELQNEVP